ncbi:nucleoside monophosphate kinase [Candidatus Dojkabacteria bacterium]|nr:nucleoside monophosphate kinase [Candidatus Dojkabacteria bacterium]
MKGISFPIIKTKNDSKTTYDLNNVEDRKKYFREKVGREIDDIKAFMKKQTFIAYMMGKKLAGKGTYSKLFMEIFGRESAVHLSVGDIVRAADEIKGDESKMSELREYMEKNYRGFISLDDAFDAFLGRSTSKLLPTEFILGLVKREIDKNKGKVLFIDGFPRSMDQVSYSLYFRELVDYRNDPDVFVFIDLPEQVIDERIKYRVVCPKCNTSRNLKLLPTSKVEYDKKKKEFYLLCDNPECEPVKMLSKEGDEKGLELIRDRLEADDKLIRETMKLYGIPKIYLRNSIPVEGALDNVDSYELTRNKSFSWDEKNQSVITKDVEWIVNDDDGIPSYSLYASAVIVQFIKQLHEVLIK